MNTLFNVKKNILMLFAVLSIAACNSKQTSGEVATTHGMEQGDHGHVHTYACPMHADIQGHEGEKCSKCGMALAHMDHAPVAGNFKMEFKASAEKIEVGKSVNLSFTPKKKDNANAAVPLDVAHEKKIHLILVSEDLSWFDHLHPEYQADGSYVVAETFPNGGKYIMYADYKPTGSMHQLEKTEVQVEGKKASPKTFTTVKTTAVTGDYAVSLKAYDGVFKSHEGIHFDGVVTKKGKAFDVNDFQSYLGAKGHMVGINIQNKEYVHLHPEVENDILHFHATFPVAGMYRVWLQFMADDKLHTVDFTLNVQQGKESSASDEHKEDDHSDHKH